MSSEQYSHRAAALMLLAMLVPALAGCTGMLIGGGTPSAGATNSGDGAVAASVKARLLDDPVLAAERIAVSSAGGRVTLRGVVATAAERDRAAMLAGTVGGVTAVENRLVVRTED